MARSRLSIIGSKSLAAFSKPYLKKSSRSFWLRFLKFSKSAYKYKYFCSASLAKACQSGVGAADCSVFDEVDSGIGGRTSDKVGIKLKRLSEKYQVICITHLAQIAKYGTAHYKIEKQVKNSRTSTVITPLVKDKDRIDELARMMGGTNISQATLDHAAEMLKTTLDITNDAV